MKFSHIQDVGVACLCLQYIKKACQCQEVSQERCDKDVKNKLSQLEGDVLSRAASTVSFCLTVSSAWLMLYWEDWPWLHASICQGFPMMLCRSLPSTVLISINMMCILCEDKMFSPWIHNMENLSSMNLIHFTLWVLSVWTRIWKTRLILLPLVDIKW